MQISFEVFWDGKYWRVRSLDRDIFTQERSLDELVRNIEEAVEAHFGGGYRAN